MKVYTIGRSPDSMVYIDDPMVSRRHALLKVYTSGKMELVDLSQNGTFVNGIQIKSNTPVPVSRKDVIKIAQVKILDWNLIPNPLNYLKYGLLAIVGLLALIMLIRLSISLYDNLLDSDDVQLENNGIQNPGSSFQDVGGNNPIVIPDSVDTSDSSNDAFKIKDNKKVTIDDVKQMQDKSKKKEKTVKKKTVVKKVTHKEKKDTVQQDYVTPYF